MSSRPLFAAVGVLACVALAAGFIGVPAPDALFHPAQALPAGTTMTHGLAWYRPFGGQYSVQDVRIQRGPTTTTIASLTIAGLQNDPTEVTLRHLQAHDIAATGLNGITIHAASVVMDTVIWPRDIVGTGADAMRAAALRVHAGHVSVDGFSGESSFVSVSLRHGELTDLAHGHVASFAIAGAAAKLAMPAPVGPIALTIDTASGQNTQIPWLDPYVFFSGDAARIAAAAPVGSVSQTQIPAAGLSSAKFHMAMGGYSSSSVMDTAGTLRINGGATSFDFDATLPKTQATLSSLLGLNDIAGSVSVAEIFATASHGLAVSVTFTLAQLGTLTEDFQAQFTPAANQQQFVAGLVLDGGRIVWRDQGLTNRILTYVAAQKNTSADGLRAGVAAALAARPNPILANQPDSNQQLANFIANPGTLTFASTPAQPVALKSLAGHPAAEVFGMLNLHLSAN